MRIALLALVAPVVFCGCPNHPATPPSPTADPIAAPAPHPASSASADPVHSPDPAGSAPGSSQPTAVPAQPAPKSQEWSIGKGTIKGVAADNDAGRKISIAVLEWKQFKRQTEPLTGVDVKDANVSFASVTADGATATDVVCKLPAWQLPESGAVLDAVAMVPLAAKDAVAVASVLEEKRALSGCAKGKKVRVHWAFESSKVVASSVEVADPDPKTKACISKVVAASAALDSGVCAATFEL